MKHLRPINGRYYFAPSKAMREAGFRNAPLGTDLAAARQYVAEQNDRYERERQAPLQEPQERNGNFFWLVHRFEQDPTWYGMRAPRTREEMDYAFRLINQTFGKHAVRKVERRHCRAFYNNLRDDGSVHKARKVMKWFHRLLEYAIEIGVRDDNPADKLRMETPRGRNQVWAPDEVQGTIRMAQTGGKASSGNIIPPRRSIALATVLGYDSCQREQDILVLQWPQYDGAGLTVTQKKTGKTVYCPLSEQAIAMLNATPKTSTYIIVSEETKQPYTDRNTFSRLFRKFARRAGVRPGLTFQDFRRTGMTEMGNSGSTEAEIVAISGHEPGSRVIKTYVVPGREAALRGAAKRNTPKTRVMQKDGK